MLWIENLAKFSKFDKLGENIGPLVLLWTLTGIHTILGYLIITDVSVHHLEKSIFHHSLIWAGITFSLWASRKLRNDYTEVTEELGLSPETHSTMRTVLFLGGMGVIVGYILVSGRVIANPLTGKMATGPGWGFEWYWIGSYLIWILVFLPMMVDFTTLIFVIHFMFPHKIRNEKEGVDWSDMERKMGLGGAGELFLKSLQIYLIGLMIVTLLPVLWGVSGLGTIALFGGGWILAVVLFFVPSFSLHTLMKSRKRDKLNDLKDRIEKHRSLKGGRLGIDEEDLDHEELSRYLFLYLEHEHAYNISEYPFGARDLREFTFTLVVPLISQLLVLGLL